MPSDTISQSNAVTAADVLSILRLVRLSMAIETQTQKQIAEALQAAGIPTVREVILDAQNRIDLMAGRVGIEVKIKGDRRRILRQIERYCSFDAIGEIVLVTGISLGLPAAINGRPIHIVSMGRAWL